MLNQHPEDNGSWTVFRARVGHQYLEAIHHWAVLIAESIASDPDGDFAPTDATADDITTAFESVKSCRKWVRLVMSMETVRTGEKCVDHVWELVPELRNLRPTRKTKRDRVSQLRGLPPDALIASIRRDLGVD